MIPKGWHRLSGCHCEGISKKALLCRLNKGEPHSCSLSRAINEPKISKGQVCFLFDLENMLFSYDGASWSQFFRLNWSSFHGLSQFLEYQGWNRTLDIINYTPSPAKQANQQTSEKHHYMTQSIIMNKPSVSISVCHYIIFSVSLGYIHGLSWFN